MGIKKRTGILILVSVAMVAVFIQVYIRLPGLDADPIHLPLEIPDKLHLLGTDNSGRDILALLIRSAGISLSIGLGSALCAVFIGASAGCAAGYLRSPVDDLIMRLADIFLLVPTLPLIIVLAAYLGPGALHVTLVIGLTAWPATARVIYAHVLKLREEPFVINAKSMGAGNVYIMLHHILPNCSELLLAKAALTVASSMLAEAGISFLGLGDPLHPSWGSMLHDAFSSAAIINGYWWWYLPPVLSISGSVVLFNLAGYFLSDTKTLTSSPMTATALASADCDISQKGSIPPLLSIENLSIGFSRSTGSGRQVVNQLTLKLNSGEKVAVIGATGSGKSLLLLSVLGLLPAGAKVSGSIRIKAVNLATYCSASLMHHRGVFTAYVPQGVGHALNPVLTVGYQVAERIRIHQRLGQGKALRAAIESLSSVGFIDPEQLISNYPHHLSGGMKQRVLLAMALSGNPSLILADEPTKGLDKSAIDEILKIFKRLKLETVLTVTHDLIFAKALCERVLVIHSGLLVEDAPADSFFHKPLHPYSRALIAACPSRGMAVDTVVEIPETIVEDQGCPYRQQCLSASQQCEVCPPLRFHQGHHIRCWKNVP